MSGAHLHSVGLHVADVEATLAFYRMLGLAVPLAAAGPVAAAPVTGRRRPDPHHRHRRSPGADGPAAGRHPTARIQIET